MENISDLIVEMFLGVEKTVNGIAKKAFRPKKWPLLSIF